MIFLKGEIFSSSTIPQPPSGGTTEDTVKSGDIFQFRGSYFVASPRPLDQDGNLFKDADDNILDRENGTIIPSKKFGDTMGVGEEFFDEDSQRTFIFTGQDLPTEGVEPFVQSGIETPLRSGVICISF